MIDMLEFRLENLSDPATLQGEALTWGMEIIPSIQCQVGTKDILWRWCGSFIILTYEDSGLVPNWPLFPGLTHSPSVWVFWRRLCHIKGHLKPIRVECERTFKPSNTKSYHRQRRGFCFSALCSFCTKFMVLNIKHIRRISLCLNVIDLPAPSFLSLSILSIIYRTNKPVLLYFWFKYGFRCWMQSRAYISCHGDSYF